MSWFNRSPRPKNPPVHLPHHRESPMSREALKEAKKRAPSKPNDDKY